MENLNKLLDLINEREYKVSNGKLNQVERNSTKAEILAALLQDLNHIAVGKCKEGIVLELPNEQEGAISVILDVKIKPLDYDGMHIVESYTHDQKEKAEAKAQRDRDRKASYKNQMKLKEMKESK